jgi:hypothetical protein
MRNATQGVGARPLALQQLPVANRPVKLILLPQRTADCDWIQAASGAPVRRGREQREQ